MFQIIPPELNRIMHNAVAWFFSGIKCPQSVLKTGMVLKAKAEAGMKTVKIIENHIVRCICATKGDKKNMRLHNLIIN